MNRTDLFLERALPSAVDVERTLLGALMLRNDLIDEAERRLAPSDFYPDPHRKLFALFVAMRAAREPVEILTVVEALRRAGDLDGVGGGSYVSSLVDGTAIFENVDFYVGIVREKANLRRLIGEANHTIASCFEQDQASAEIASRLASHCDALATESQKADPRPLGVVTREFFERLEAREGLAGVPTGIRDFDAMTGGLRPGNLIVLAARPSMGKSALAAQIALAAAEAGHPALVFSLEMTADEIAQRLASSRASVDLHRIRMSYLNREEYGRLAEAMWKFDDAPLYLDDRGDVSPADIRATARSLKRGSGLGLIVVDYLQLLTSRGLYRPGETTAEVGYFSRQLKTIAKEFDVPVVALSQLSRSCERREDKRPLLSDLRDSGAVEQDADLVAFIYREELYEATEENRGTAELIVRKQRNGPTGTIRLAFLKEFARFEPLWSEGY